MTSTAAPRPARSISAWRMVAAAPASTPQVGWLTTSTPGSRRISRPTTNFCRLPPDRLDGFRIALGLAHVEGLGGAIDGASVAGLLMKPSLDHAARGVAGEQRVLGQFHARRGAMAEPFLGDEGRAQAPPRR